MFTVQRKHLNSPLFYTRAPESEFRLEATQFVWWTQKIFLFTLHFRIKFIEVLKYIGQVCEFRAPLCICNSLPIGTLWVLLLTRTVGPRPFRVRASGQQCAATSFARLPFPRIMEKRWDFNGRAFMKWTMSTAPSSTSERSFGKVLATSASLWRKQCVVQTFWFCALILLMKPLTLPVIAAAPSVQILIQFFQLRPPCSRYSDVTRYISSLVVLCGKHLQNQKFSRISPPSTNLTNPKSCAWPLTSVDSLTCKENFPHSLIFSKTTSSMSADMSLIRLPMVEFESGTFAISLAACFTSCTQ